MIFVVVSRQVPLRLLEEIMRSWIKTFALIASAMIFEGMSFSEVGTKLTDMLEEMKALEQRVLTLERQFGINQ
ncbi:hypothetical protein C0581_03900 [Candidatus Parcubacteria bacterium]|nr:MAG: hypothetical protein C0581_03900 [Candidatus Parcubacteria bacterium]